MNRLTSQSVNLRMRTDPAIDEPFDQGDESGYQFFHEAQTKGLPSFDKVSPYGAARTQLRLISTMSPAAEWSRRRFIQALARLDSTTIVDGGWMLPLGQESSLNDIVDVFRRLPPKRFQTVTSNVQTQPVLVRTLQHNSDTYVYVINDSPWPIRANLELEVPAGKLPLSLSQNRRIHTLKRNGLKSIWPVKLKPYDLVGVVFSKSNVSVRSVNVNEQDRNRAVNALTNQWRKDKGKFDRDRNQRVPLTAITNSTFEVVRPNEPLVGWSHGYAPRQQQDGSIQLSKQVGQGSTSLQLMNNGQGILWLRSNQFNSPETARLMISVRIRGNKADRPPPLRIGLDAKRNGQVYYRYKQIRPDPDKKTPHDKWLIYELQMTDLPISGLTDLRIAFDLVAPGMAWIDDVQLFKRWLSKGERQAFLETLASNKIAIQQGRVTDCQRFLESYWPAYIERNAQVERVAQQPDAPAKPANSRPNYFPNFNRLWPKLF